MGKLRERPSEIKLCGRERRVLARVIRAHSSEQRWVLRASIVLLAWRKRNNSEIADELGCDLKTVRKWRERFADHRLEGLDDAPRSGRPPHFGATQKHDLFSMVVEPPPPPFARWTIDMLVTELITRGIVPCIISRETVSLWLRCADIKPHRCRYWLQSNDPEFKEKKDRVVDLYLNPPTDGRLICVDEKTCIQARERLWPGRAARRGLAARADFHYKRHGVVNLLAAFDVPTGYVMAECLTGRNNSEAFMRFVRRLMKRYPDEKLYLVLDNGTTHKSKATMAFFASHPNLVPVFLPTHGSWLNQIEIWFSHLSRKTLKNASFTSRDDLIGRINEFVDEHNRWARPYRWTSKGDPLKGDRPTSRRKKVRQRRRSFPATEQARKAS